MYILLWIIFGAFVGWIASIISNDNGRMGLLANIVVGLIGSVIGGGIASLFNLATFTTFSLWGFCFAVLGAVVLLWIISLFRVNRRR